ncbi:hypothetical protein [Geoglobus ahangari]
MEVRFDPETLQTLHMRAGDLWRRNFSRGWQRSAVSPMEVVRLFDRLWVREGYELVAYIYGFEVSSLGVVWAVKEGTPTEIEECERLEDELGTPRPCGAVEITEVIEGDGSSESYMQASILVRELRDFGCTFEHSDWGWHEIIGDFGKFEVFFREVNPTPKVSLGDRAVVEFCTRSYRTGEVYRHVDEFADGYRFTSSSEVIGFAD